jgi:hypothetical protein
MSAQQLADRCAELGLEIPRAVLANLETGRRPLVSVAELLVLAAALEVPPLALAIPIARQETTEILPGVEVPTLDAAGWWQGAMGMVDLRSENGAVMISETLGRETAIQLVRMHQDSVARWRSASTALRQAAGAAHRADPAEAGPIRTMLQVQQQNLDHFAREVCGLRRLMRDQGLIPPPLPLDLAYLDEADATS